VDIFLRHSQGHGSEEVIVPLVIVGVMGPGEGATARDREDAYQLGRAIAQEGWSLVTGGRNEGVMDSASRGAKEVGGLTIGVLPSKRRSVTIRRRAHRHWHG
jgi:uncharacterized protein (TIGR00725 family)